MNNILRVAITQTKSAFLDMPERADELDRLAGRLDDVRQANLDHNERLIAHAAGEGARIVGLGELFTAPYFALEKRELWLGLAEDAREGATARHMSRVAREHGVVVVAPIYELDRNGRRFNTALVIDDHGRLIGTYRKTHIPFGTNEVASFHENFYYERSDGRGYLDPAYALGESPHFPVFRTSACRLGIAICYDRHFDGVVRSLARGGAQLVLCPAVSFGDKSRRMWHLEAPTDAMRHRLYIGASNRRGVEPPWTIEYYGESYFVGPNGVLEDRSTHPELVIADLDLDELGGADPSGWNIQRDRREDIYH